MVGSYCGYIVHGLTITILSAHRLNQDAGSAGFDEEGNDDDLDFDATGYASHHQQQDYQDSGGYAGGGGGGYEVC